MSSYHANRLIQVGLRADLFTDDSLTRRKYQDREVVLCRNMLCKLLTYREHKMKPGYGNTSPGIYISGFKQQKLESSQAMAAVFSRVTEHALAGRANVWVVK